MQQLVFVTNNRHKMEEVARKISDKIELLSLADIGCFDEIAETGSTFHENAALKSNFIYKKYHLDCFADDSGLEVDALKGEPGIYSARYAGVHGDHEANISKVLEKLTDETNRSARFKTVISLVWKGESYFFEGAVEGTIRLSSSGIAGFGYDPIFEPDGYDKTFAEMTMDEKNRISHRGKALDELAAFLSKA